MLHPSKSQSILQWFNALTTNVDVQSLAQFADGSLFCDIVTSVYSQAQIENPIPPLNLPDCTVHEESSANTSAIEKSTSELVKEAKDSEDDASTSKEVDKEEEAEELSKNQSITEESFTKGSIIPVEVKKKYHAIKKFIDVFFQMDSKVLIKYTGCFDGEDLELAKVAVMLLSAMVQNFLSSQNEALHTITLLESSVQEDIMECLALFISRVDKEPLTKAEFHRVLSKAAKYKATPRRKTPLRGNSEPVELSLPKKRRGERIAAIVYEDVQDSPLKGLLQSPNNSQHRSAIALFKKETELSRLRNSLHAEEIKVTDLILEKRDISNELLKKKEELDHLKSEFRNYREAVEEREGHAGMERANFLEEIKKLKEDLLKQNKELKEVQADNKSLDSTVFDLEKKLHEKFFSRHSDERVMNAVGRISELEQQNLLKENELQDYKKKLEVLDDDLKAYKQMYEDSLNRRKSPMVTPVKVPETVSSIHSADFEEKLLEKDQEVEKAKKITNDLKIQLKLKADNTKAVLHQFQNLQEKHEKLENTMRSCSMCSSVINPEDGEASRDSSVHDSSSQVGRLWDATSRENVPNTRSRSISGVVTSITVNPGTVEKLKTLIRTFIKLLIKWKIVDDCSKVQQLETLTNKLETVEEFVSAFERTISVIKKTLPAAVENFIKDKDIKALKEMDQDGNSKQALDKPTEEYESDEYESLKTRFQKQLGEKERDYSKNMEEAKKEIQDYSENIKKAKKEIENLKNLHDTAEKENKQFKSEIRDWKMKYDAARKHAEKYKLEKIMLLKWYDDHQKKIKENENKVEPCGDCKKFREGLAKAKDSLSLAQKKAENFKPYVKDLENKIKSYERRVQDLVNEKEKLKLKIEHKNISFLGDSIARTAVIRKHSELSKATERNKGSQDIGGFDFAEESQPVVNVNTYILHREKKGSHNETSMSSHFGNRSVKSVYLPTDDEEDFLNHSSLAQIQNGVYHDPEAENSEDRLRELQRRNTFCPPHLQSSYPLELQQMTPSERKYSMVTSRPSEVHRRYQSKRYEPEASTSSNSMAVKRKVSETDATQPLVPHKKVKPLRISSLSRPSASKKPVTPIRQTIIGKGRTFKTPSSIRRLMGMQTRKNKLQ